MMKNPWLCGVGVGVSVGVEVAVGSAEGRAVTLGFAVSDGVTVGAGVDVSVANQAVAEGSAGGLACFSEHPAPTVLSKTMTKSQKPSARTVRRRLGGVLFTRGGDMVSQKSLVRAGGGCSARCW